MGIPHAALYGNRLRSPSWAIHKPNRQNRLAEKPAAIGLAAIGLDPGDDRFGFEETAYLLLFGEFHGPIDHNARPDKPEQRGQGQNAHNDVENAMPHPGHNGQEAPARVIAAVSE